MGVASADHAVAEEHSGAIYYTYTAPAATDSFGGVWRGIGGQATAEEPSHAELLAAIQGARVALEGEIETVAVEVNLLRADLRKVSDKVKVAGGTIVDLQTEVGTLRKQMAQVSSTVGKLEERCTLMQILPGNDQTFPEWNVILPLSCTLK
ncbi:hypothetical protein NDU88_005882 [Pleurodeles waltl]|uniref:Uncharacterized protein n=1 Tax=Pleurodeles waltl TaxID=8319 RepID=A0AAV7LMJ8_PLEWA|nr:hypothetical protein NDU88_005882 [Pleurodeles waltl]